MTQASALEHLRRQVSERALSEQRTADGLSVLLAIRAPQEPRESSTGTNTGTGTDMGTDIDIEALYDPTRPDGGVGLRAEIGPLPSDPALRASLVERLLQINHSFARRFGASLFVAGTEVGGVGTEADRQASTETGTTGKSGENIKIHLKSRLGIAPLEDSQFRQKLVLFSHSAAQARNLLERIMAEKNSKKGTIATDRVRL